MAASIDAFKGMANSFDFNYGNRFLVKIGGAGELFSAYCEQASLPGRSFATSDVKFGTGFTQKMPYNSIFDDVSMTFKLDSGMRIKKFFDAWQNKIHNKGTGYMEYYDNYKEQVMIEVYNRQDEVVYTCTIFDAYPISVASTDMSHSTQNEILKLNVTFAYKTWGSQ